MLWQRRSGAISSGRQPDRHIQIPATKATTLVFGGPDLRDLYISTGDNTEDPSRGGGIYRMRSDVSGMPVPKAKLRARHRLPVCDSL